VAEQGDKDMAKLYLDRVSPVPKGRRVYFDWPAGLGLDGIARCFDAVLPKTRADAFAWPPLRVLAGFHRQWRDWKWAGGPSSDLKTRWRSQCCLLS
jgi:hypothetical protein